jgi:hypothetical protein
VTREQGAPRGGLTGGDRAVSRREKESANFFFGVGKKIGGASDGENKGAAMNLDPAMTTGYVIVAVGGFGLGALAGRWMMAEMRSALGAVQLRLSALEQKVIGYGAAPAVTANGNAAAPTSPIAHPAATVAAAPQPAPAPVAPTAVTAATAQAAALEHHASAVEKLAAAIDRHAQAVDDHGAATVAAAVEMGSYPAAPSVSGAPVLSGPAATFSAPTHAAAMAMGASVAPVAAAAVAAAPQG